MVYVDDAKNPFGRMLMSHMIADTEDELHKMAKRIGLQRKWYQPNHSHYDVCQSKKKLAISYGAVEITSQELVSILRRAKIRSKVIVTKVIETL